MVDRGYLPQRRPGPSGTQRRFNQVAMPALIDAAALLEAGLERLAVGARRTPETALAIALGVGLGLGLALRHRRR